MEFLYDYGLFFLKTATFFISFLIFIILFFVVSSKKSTQKQGLTFTDLSSDYYDQTLDLKENLLSKKEFKQLRKKENKQNKAKEKQAKDSSNLFVLDFVGDIEASSANSLEEEITALLSIADPKFDEVLLRLESPGGVVHGYGFAASQLLRLKKSNIKLTVAIDKVAASGGYLMASCAQKIIASPFAIVGSIGVIAQLPNFNKILKKYDIDYEEHTAGEYKRTLTLFGENTKKGREKFQEDLSMIHEQFKNHIQENRKNMNIKEVATGEFWLASSAIDKNLVDKLQLAEDFIIEAIKKNKKVIKLSYQEKQSLMDKIQDKFALSFSKIFSYLNHIK